MHIDDHEKAGRLIRSLKRGIQLREAAWAGTIKAEVHFGSERINVFDILDQEQLQTMIVAQVEAFVKDTETQLANLGVTVAERAQALS